jgi:AcrR family transcriptional regulator
LHQKRTRDRRVQKTEALLRGALGALIRERPYDEIVVKEILHRANVGRSTFYAHFSDKNDLLQSCVRDMLRPVHSAGERSPAARPYEAVVRFGLPIFSHIEEHRRTGQARVEGQGRRVLHEHLQEAIAALIEGDVEAAVRRRGTAEPPSTDLLVRWIASTFVLVLNWWVESDRPIPAREADRLFRRLVEPALAEALG